MRQSELATKGFAVDAPRKVPAPAAGPAPEEQAHTLVEWFKATVISALEASQAARLGRVRSARTQDCDPHPPGRSSVRMPRGCRVDASCTAAPRADIDFARYRVLPILSG